MPATGGRREIFYWVTVLATFALGTTVGDLSAFTLHLGYLASAALYAVLIAVPALAWWRLRLNAVVAFWAAYVLTRSLGASVADWLGKPSGKSGLGFGDGTVTVVTAIAMPLPPPISEPCQAPVLVAGRDREGHRTADAEHDLLGASPATGAALDLATT